MTATDTKNHTVNPASALDMMDSAEARMDANANFSDGVFTRLLGQNLGVYSAWGVVASLNNRTRLVGSSTAEVYNRGTGDAYQNNAGDAEKTKEGTSRWYTTNSGVDFGLSYQMTPKLVTPPYPFDLANNYPAMKNYLL